MRVIEHKIHNMLSIPSILNENEQISGTGNLSKLPENTVYFNLIVNICIIFVKDTVQMEIMDEHLKANKFEMSR